MAETSGFATDLPQSTYLAHTIRRAISAAEQRSHRYVTLEHLLFALLDDPDAQALFEGARADIAGLRSAAAETVNNDLATLYTPGEFDLRASYKVERVLQSASDDARRMGCAEVDGSFVAVALFHETDSPAYDLLKRHNFVFHAANGWLDRNRGTRSAKYASPPLEEPVPPPPDAESEVPEPPGDELEDEMLLDEVVEDAAAGMHEADYDDDEADALRRAAAGDEIEPVQWPVARAPLKGALSKAEGDVSWSRASSPLRPIGERPSAGSPGHPRQEPNFGAASARREVASPSGWQIGPAVRRPTLDQAEIERDRFGRGRIVPPPPEAGRAEPRFQVPPAPAPGADKTQAPRPQPAPGGMSELRPRSEPAAAGNTSQDLGTAIPGRDFPPAGRASEPQDGRASRPHASARERSATTTRPVLTAPPSGAEGPSPNGAIPVRRSNGSGAPVQAGMPSASAPAPRLDPGIPPTTRLDDMRVRPNPPAAAKPAARKPGATRDKDGDKSARGRRKPQAAAAVYAGKLAENIPRKMRAHIAMPIEVRVSREETETFLSGFEGDSELFRHNITVTQAMSVMLRAPDGGFTIENLGPETQWISTSPGFDNKEPFGRWLWSVTPTVTGKRRLQLVVAARSVDENGLAGDTALPDQVITVEVRANFTRNAVQALKWLALMALGGVVTEGTLVILKAIGG